MYTIIKLKLPAGVRMENRASNNQDDYNTNKMKQAISRTFLCPYCGNSVTLVSYGSGWVGTCCGRIVYNSNQLPAGC